MNHTNFETEKETTINTIKRITTELIESGGGKVKYDFEEVSNLNMNNIQYFERESYYGALRLLKSEFEKDPKIESIRLIANGIYFEAKVKVNKKYKEPEVILTPEEIEKERKNELDLIKKRFNEFKKTGNHFIASYRDISKKPEVKELINNYFIPSQTEWETINGGQYKLTTSLNKEKPQKERKNNTNAETINEFDFDINFKSEFNERCPDDNLKKFLSESKKIPISEDLAFIPVKINNLNNYQYVMFLDNQTETLSLFRIKNLRYINDQSNLNKLLNSILPLRMTNKHENYHSFLKRFTQRLSKHVTFNEKLLNEIYGETKDIYKDKRILKQFYSDDYI